MKKTGSLILLISILLILSSNCFASSQAIDNGITYLYSTQGSDGSWSGNATDNYYTTAEVLNTLLLFDRTGNEYTSGLNWIASQPVEDIDMLVRRVGFWGSAGDISTLLSYINQDGGWGSYPGDVFSTVIDTSFALRALKAVNYSDQTVFNNALSYLLSAQNTDGGWGYCSSNDVGCGDGEGDSNVYMTALVSRTFQQFPKTTSIATAINKAMAYLIAHQNADGGYGIDSVTGQAASTVHETALALIAMINANTGQVSNLPLQTAIQKAINYLLSAQLSDGSWNNDPYSTALALRALANVKPNLAITAADISFSTPAPTVGQAITITASIHNTGMAQANNVLIQFYSGDPSQGGTLIGGTTIPSIPAFGSSPASIIWTIPTASTNGIFVSVDPLNTIDELNKSDNIASKNLTSATLPDLSITSADITFSPQIPLPSDSVTITATIRNNGETGASNFTVDIYDGNPSASGVNIFSTTVPSIGAGSSVTLQATAHFAAGSHNINIVVDKANSVIENSKTNNAATKTLQVGNVDIDLMVTNYDITSIPVYPAEGDLVTINATIHNLGDAEAKNAPVRFYLGDPDSGGSQIGSDINIPSVPARGMANISTTWNSTGHAGNNNIYVKIDPLNTIIETTKFNNIAFKTIRVVAKTGPDLAVSAADMNFIPLTPNKGDTVTITANVRNIGTADATNVLVEFSLGDPNIGGTLIIGSQRIPLIAKGSVVTAQLAWNTTGFSGEYEVYVNVNPFYEIPETNELNNIAHATLDVKAPQGPDLTITQIDTSNLITDTQTLIVSGTIKATIQNIGNQPTNAPFDITVFEDTNKNKTFDPGTDNILGKITYTGSLAAGATVSEDIPVSGNILFRDNRIYMMVDSGNTISELDETNNMRNTGEQCEYKPPVGTFNPVEKWHWQGVKAYPTFNKVMMTPVVARIADTNGDGVIDDKDVPAVIFSAFESNNCGVNCPGILTAVRGDTGEEIWSVTNPLYRTSAGCSLAVGDIDNDGMLEIVAIIFGGDGYSNNNKIAVFNHDGTLRWMSSQSIYIPWGGASIADLEGDGKPEIIIGATVFNNDGTLRWQGTKGTGNQYVAGPLSLVADIDMDGHPEVVAGNTVYRHDGTVYWQTSYPVLRSDGYDAVANFDNDPYPEIVFVSVGSVYLLKHDGTTIWGPVAIPGGGGGPPTIADFDGDGKLEIGIAGSSRYVVFRSDGSILWQSVTQDLSSGVTGSSVFDFDGDGQAEVIYNDETTLRIYRGKDGMVLFSTPNSTATTLEYPVIADIDNDNHAEIVVAANDWYPYIPKTSHGIRVFKDANNSWVNTRKIWNQHTYHITNVNDDGTIPRYEKNNWETYNNYRCNSLLPDQALGTPDLTTSYITIDQNNYPSSVTVTARIGNGGALSQAAGVDVAFYDGDPSQGGIFIGTSQTANTLDPGDYEDVSIKWSNPSSGNHTVFVVADKDNKIHECREDNNTASASFTLGVIAPPPALNMPDLTLSASDISLIPPGTMEGQPAVIDAIVHNIGTAGASNVEVAFYDGDPQSGGVLIGSVTKSYIDKSATTLAEINWNTFGQSGRNYIHVVIDPNNRIAESNENNNSAFIPVDVTPPSKPDLAITSSDITFTSLNPKEGDPLTINATIHNLGTDTSDIDVALYDGDPLSGGIVLSRQTVAQTIPFGGQLSLSFAVTTLGNPGAHNFYIVLDPDNKIDEISKANNTAWNSLTIGPSNLSLGVTPDKSVYAANENVGITVNIGNLANLSHTGTLGVKIEDLNNNVVSIVAGSQALTLNPNENLPLTYTWNTGQILSGNYKVYSDFIEGGNIVAKAEAPITISPDKNIFSKVVTDKIYYTSNQPVTIISTVTGLSANYIFANLTANVTITNSQGTSLFTDTRAIPIITPGQLIEQKTYWNTGTSPQGTYTSTLLILQGAAVLSTSTSTFQILPSSGSGEGLTGTITAQPNPVDQGKDETLTYSITNKGNEDISNLSVKVIIVNADTQEVKNTFTGTANLPMTVSVNGNFIESTSNLLPRTYIAILQVSAAMMAQPKTLASTPFTVRDITPPVLTVSTLSDGSWTNNQLLNVAGTVTDDTGVQELNINGTVVTVNPDGSFSYPVSLQQGPNTITVAATDLAVNQATNTRTINFDGNAPIITITSPVDNIKTKQTPLDLTGSVDEQTTVTVKVNTSDPIPAVMDGTNFSLPITPDYGINTIEVTATDLAGNTSTAKRTVTFDDRNPSLSVTNPAQDIKTNQANMGIKGEVSDITAVTVTLTMDGNTYTPVVTDGKFEQPVTFGDEKTYQIYVTATNEVGNETTVQRNIVYDITPPAVTIDPVTSPTNINNQVVTGTMEAGAIVNVSCPTATVGTVSYSTATTWTAQLSNMKEGNDAITVTATDEVGNTSLPISAQITVDLTPPGPPVIISPPNGSMMTIDTVAIKGTAEPGSTISMNFGSVINTQADPATGAFTYSGVKLNAGNNAFVFTASDRAGNVSSQTQYALTFNSTSTTGEGIIGTITAQQDPVYQGKDDTLLYTITNNGNENVATLNIKVLIINSDTQEIKKSFESTVSLPMNVTTSGSFKLSAISLEPRTYSAVLQISTPLMAAPKTIANTTFTVKPGIEATKTIPDITNLLVWVNDDCQKDCSRYHAKTSSLISKNNEEKNREQCDGLDLLNSILKDATTSYRIVFDKQDFEKELRNPYYTDILILGKHESLGDEYGEELREKVNSGTGIISALWQEYGEGGCNSGNGDVIFGVNHEGEISCCNPVVNTIQSPITTDGTISTKGKAEQIGAEAGTTIAGWIKSDKNDSHKKGNVTYPAIVLNTYGEGKTIYFAFDLGATINNQNSDQIASIIKKSITYIHKQTDTITFHVNQLVPIETTLQSLGGAFDLKITETYPSEIKLYDPSTEKWITDNPWITNIHLAPNDTKTNLYYALTPDKGGAYTLKTEVGYMENGSYNFYKNLNVDITVERGTAQSVADIIQKLKMLSVSRKDKAKVDDAIKHMSNVQNRAIYHDEDIEKNIRDILGAIESLLSVTGTDVSAIRLMVDSLLETWEGRWYYNY